MLRKLMVVGMTVSVFAGVFTFTGLDAAAKNDKGTVIFKHQSSYPGNTSKTHRKWLVGIAFSKDSKGREYDARFYHKPGGDDISAVFKNQPVGKSQGWTKISGQTFHRWTCRSSGVYSYTVNANTTRTIRTSTVHKG